MGRSIFAVVSGLVVAAVLLVLAWPQPFGLQLAPAVAQAVSLRGAQVGVAALLVVLCVLVALVARPARGLAGGLAILLVLFSGVNLAVLGVRGFGSPGFQTVADGDLVVLSWNTLGDAPGAGEIARVILDEQADVVVLPETSQEAATQIVATLGEQGRPMQPIWLSYDRVSKARTTVLLVGQRLGSYHRDESVEGTRTLPSLVARPDDGTGPVLVAAHPVAPVTGELANWRAGLDWLAAACAGEDVILAGDLNSTLDHYEGLGVDGGELGRCRDGAKATGNAAVGTWPTNVPELFGAPIDHVMATPEWEVVGFRVLGSEDGAGSDHRPVVAQLRPAG